MKYLVVLFAGLGLVPEAHASDWSDMRGAYGPQSGHDWSGTYIGGQVGQGWGHAKNDFWNGGTSAWDPDGDIDYKSLTGGLHIGVQQQFHAFAAGIEADLSLAHFYGDDAQVAGRVNEIAINALGTLRGRLAWTAGNLMVYGTAGLALAQFKKTDQAGRIPANAQLAGGWTAGGGVEMALDGNWSIRAEYLHTRLNDTETAINVNDPPFVGTYAHRANAPAINLLRIGASYRF